MVGNVLTYMVFGLLANHTMSDEGPYCMARTRALLTETEREQIAGEHGDKRKYEATSRVRRRVNEELTSDIELLEEHHPDLLDELRDVVCDDAP
jgi:hypothetical protein